MFLQGERSCGHNSKSSCHISRQCVPQRDPPTDPVILAASRDILIRLQNFILSELMAFPDTPLDNVMESFFLDPKCVGLVMLSDAKVPTRNNISGTAPKEIRHAIGEILLSHHRASQRVKDAVAATMLYHFRSARDTIPFLEERLRTAIDALGANHIEVEKILERLGNAHGQLGDAAKQRDLLERALRIKERHYGPDHFQVAITLTSIGNAHGELGDAAKKRDPRSCGLRTDIMGQTTFRWRVHWRAS